MVNPESKAITPREAAKLIFRTDTPTQSQVSRVEDAIARNELKGTRRGAIVMTTPACVALFLADKSIERREKRLRERQSYETVESDPSPAKACVHRNRSPARTDEMSEMFRTSLKEYFLSVLLIRKMKRASKRYQQFVLAGQIFLLVLGACFVIGVILPVAAGRTPQEHVLIENWLEENTQEYKINEFYPLKQYRDGNGIVIRVAYHYRRPPGKGVDTIQYFTIADQRIVRVDSELP